MCIYFLFLAAAPEQKGEGDTSVNVGGARSSEGQANQGKGDTYLMDHSQEVFMRSGHLGNRGRKRGFGVQATVQTTKSLRTVTSFCTHTQASLLMP